MKNLKELAAEYDLYTAEDIPAKWRITNAGRIKNVVTGIPEFLLKCDLIEIAEFYDCRTEDKGTPKECYYIEYGTHILLKAKSNDHLLELFPEYRKKGKYSIGLYSRLHWKYHNIDRHKLAKITDAIQRPNAIGVFTDKKVAEWLQYRDEYIKASDTLLEDVTGENTAIEKEIQRIKDRLPDARINDHGDTVWLTTKLFEIKLVHNRASCYLERKVTFNGSVGDVIYIENKIK